MSDFGRVGCTGVAKIPGRIEDSAQMYNHDGLYKERKSWYYKSNIRLSFSNIFLNGKPI